MTDQLSLYGLGVRVDVRLAGERADLLASSMREAWARCLEEPEWRGVQAHSARIEAAPLEVRLDDPARLVPRLMRATQEITLALITAQIGRLLMFHAGAVSHPVTGDTLVYVAPGGTGKTTLSRQLGARFGYVTDETVGIDEAGAVLPYPKPLSVRRPEGGDLKDEVSPDALGLAATPRAPRVTRVVLLDRDPGSRSVEVEEVAFMDALFALTEQSSSLPKLRRPLHRLARLIDSVEPVLRFRYAEAVEIEDELADLIGGVA